NKMEMKLLEHILDDASSWTEPLKAIVPIHYGELTPYLRKGISDRIL
ncbi:unnamed protein product, partial [marine sediment metagenome]